MLIDTLLPFRTVCRSTHYDYFLPYADRYIITISYHMLIDTLLPFRTICRSTHYDHFVPYADRYITWSFRTICRTIHYMTISYHMQIDTLYDHFDLHMVRNSHNVSICIRYEMVIMYRSAYGTKWQWYKLIMIRKWFSLW
jgi:hypothetical protein